MTDFNLQNSGGLFILYAESDDAKQWVADHLPEDAMTWGKNGTVIEHRYVGDIAACIQNDGLSIAPLQAPSSP